ncbi:MAG: hypothetical protein A2Z91_03695 [Deltaproteobacteria bacterium GWA2_38_16]|nr:MAG: hypothetical protein A2Z91_03695 [Deltaproteobacteria bacterium GWA2_38_16]OGQ02136.1 MAG: hypothetical protein A3D19_00415 [Deltaproteobacteria bacterium RIFCSPHIGHO2_02_FULL_38_15]OGQ34188.1 MAG: hypothetical protein A3A72_02770 [Deltaproteobacteria bacterium RIFCSPLOWO2_01_FULL_38_9]
MDIKTYGPAKLLIKNNVRILELRGTEEEMAFQHGTLLAQDIQKGPIPYLSKKFEFELQNDGPLKKHPLLQKVVLKYMDWVFKHLIAYIPLEYKKVVKALSTAANISEMDILRAASMPDAMTILSRHAAGRFFLKKQNIQTFGCTSFIVLGEMTQTQELMQGRNLDFPVAEYWDKYASVLYCYPKEGQKYCSITSGGIQVPGVTGFNESGLILAIHQLFSTHVTSHGMPVVILCDEIVRKAKTINEAIEIVKNIKRAGNWAISLASHKEKRAVVIETSPSQVYVRESTNGLIAQSNFCFSEKLKNHEMFFNLTTAEDNHFRHDRLIDECQRLKGQMDEKKGIALLGDHFDQKSQATKAIGRVVSTIYNVQSAFFRPEQKKFWVSTGMAPANLSDFMELPFDFDWNLETYDFNRKISPNPFIHTHQGEAMRAYTKAYDYFSNDKDFEKTVECLNQALAQDSSEFAFHLAKGFMLLKLRRFDEALKAFEVGKTITLSVHESALLNLFQGRSLDLLNRRSEALSFYAPYLETIKIDHKLQKAFQRSYQRSYKDKDIDKTIFQFIFADFLAY